MKILHVITGLRVGGAERFLQRLILASGARHGLRHTVISLVELGPVGAELRAAGIEVHPIESRGALSLLWKIPKLVRLIRGLSPDIVQTWMYHADIVGGIAAKIATSAPIAWNVRVALGPLKLRTRVLVRVAAFLSKTIPDRIVCCGPVVLRDHADIGYAAEKLVVIPNGYDLARFAATADDLARRAAHDSGDITILSVGRYDPQKGYPALIETVARLQESGVTARFRLVGPGCIPANRALADQIDSHGVTSRFELAGPADDMRRVYADADIFCLPSLFEGFPNVLAEAMAMALPCVATDAGDAATLAGQYARVVPPGNVDALAGALAAIIALSPAERQSMGSAARRHIEANYALDHVAGLYVEFYRRLAKRPPNQPADI